MTGQISRDGPGPRRLRPDQHDDDERLGSVLVEIYAGRESVAIDAADSAREELVRGRFNLYALEQTCQLIRRCAEEYERAQARALPSPDREGGQ